MKLKGMEFNWVRENIFRKTLCIFLAAVFIQLYAEAGENKEGLNLSAMASESYLKDSMDWMAEQNLGEKGRGEFKYLWRSYKEDPKHGWSHFIARTGRTWIYDDALGIYAELKFAKWAETRGDKKETEKHYQNARKAVDSLIKLAEWEKKKGFKGLWHFCYDTRGDYISPMGPMGANLWGLNAIYAYILQTGDTTHLSWINNEVKTFIFSQQVMNKEDPRFGLIQSGLRTSGADQNAQMTWCNIEHNVEFLGTLRLAAKVNQGSDPDFVSELARRHELCVKAMIKNFWQGDHFCTLVTETGEVNKLVSADTTSWAPLVLMPYMDGNDVWKCVQYLKNRFRIEIKEGEQANGWHWGKSLAGGRMVIIENEKVPFKNKATGLFFFSKEYSEGLSAEEGEKLEKMIHIEATAYAGLFLLEFAKHTKDEKQRQEAVDFLKEIYRGIVAVKEVYGGRGTPYATLNVPEYSNTMESMSSTGPGTMITIALLGLNMDDFLGVVPPEDFSVDGKAPYTNLKD